MSNITIIMLLMAVGLGHAFITMVLDKRMINEVEMVVTRATSRGVPVPASHCRMVFSRYVAFYGNIVTTNVVLGIGYFLVGQYTDFTALRWLAYLYAFLSVAVALGYLLPAHMWYRHVRSSLRHAEPD